MYSMFAYFVVSTRCSIIQLDLSEYNIGIPIRNRFGSDIYNAGISFRQMISGSPYVTRLTNTTRGETVQVSVVDIMQPIPPVLDSGFGSVSVFSFILLPRPQPRLVLNPAHPTDHIASERFVSLQSTSQFWAEVRASVSILNSSHENITSFETVLSNATHTHYFCFDGSDFDAIPRESMNELYHEILARGIPVRADMLDGDVHRITLEEDTDSWIALLPTIQYTLKTSTGAPVALVHLTGKDYIIRHQDQQPLIAMTGSRTPRFGFAFLSSIAVFVDNRNRVIGFGEPRE